MSSYGNSSQNECILAIGDTGLGKSFTATIFGAKNVGIGNSTKSETKKATFYDIGNNSFYVDTPGFNDSNEKKTDDETVRSILRKMYEKKISSITTILWFVTSECRATASLKRQARIIEAFAQDHDDGNVWDNTIIVTKDDKCGEGPRAAAEKIAKKFYERRHKHKPDAGKKLLKRTGNFEIFLFEELEDRKKRLYDRMTNDEMSEYKIFRKSEPTFILEKYKSLMKNHKYNPIVFKFRKAKCLNCVEETDPRLANPKCHLEKKLIHPKPLKIVHTKGVGNFHCKPPVAGKFTKQMSHSFGAWAARVITLGLVNIEESKFEDGKWSCCGRKFDAVGCQFLYECCRNSVDSDGGCTPKHSCCDTEVHDCTLKGCELDNCKVNPGCELMCPKCKNVPVKTEGCSIEGEHVWSK